MNKYEKTIRDFVYNSCLAGVRDVEYNTPTNADLEVFFNAREQVGLIEYRRISEEETQRFKNDYDL